MHSRTSGRFAFDAPKKRCDFSRQPDEIEISDYAVSAQILASIGVRLRGRGGKPLVEACDHGRGKGVRGGATAGRGVGGRDGLRERKAAQRRSFMPFCTAPLSSADAQMARPADLTHECLCTWCVLFERILRTSPREPLLLHPNHILERQRCVSFWSREEDTDLNH